MVVTGTVFLIILLVVEYRLFEGIVYWIRGFFERKLPVHSETDEQIDSDVDNEKNKVMAMTWMDLKVHNLVLRNISKFYNRFLAVNQISLAIKR